MCEVTSRWPCEVWGTGQRSFDLLALDDCRKVVVEGRPVSKLTHSVSTGCESQLSEGEDRGASVWGGWIVAEAEFSNKIRGKGDEG